MKTLNATPAIVGLALGLLAICGFTPLTAQTQDNAYAAHRLVWTVPHQKAEASPDADREGFKALKAERLVRQGERNALRVIDRLTRDIEARVVRTLNGAP